VAMPHELAWHVDQDTDSVDADAVCALDRLLADTSAASPAQSMDVDMPSAASPTAAAGHAAAAAVALDQQQQMQQSAHDGQDGQVDGKLSLLLQLHPQLRRVGIALGVEVRGGVQQQVSVGSIYRWPLLMAAAERLHLPLEQLFQVRVRGLGGVEAGGQGCRGAGGGVQGQGCCGGHGFVMYRTPLGRV
jgi:hypothetical protein